MNLGNGIKPDTLMEYSLDPFFDLSHDILCIAGFDGYFKRVNPTVCSVLGYTEEELLSKPISHFQHPDDKEITRRFRDSVLNGKPLTHFENRYITKEGKVVWFAWTSIPVVENELVYAIAKNITHKKQHESERNHLLSELSKNNHRLMQLSYTTSHDLRAPVGNLISIFNLINESEMSNVEISDFIKLLKKAAENLKETLDNYVDTLTIQESKNIDRSDVDILDTINSVRQSIDTLIQDSNTTFHIDLKAFSSINFNHRHLESIFLNLISNSIKYSHPERDPVITIKAIHTDDGMKKLIFSDNGIGFDSEKHKDHVFGMNQTFHENRDSKGIGLYLVYSHMTSLGGKITVESKVEVGTTFTLLFRQ